MRLGVIGPLSGVVDSSVVRRHADVEPFEPDVRHVLAPQTYQVRIDRKPFDDNERGHVGPSPLPDDQVFAFGAEARKHAQLQIAQLDLAVEPL